jgi:tetratricopeptide (TPR) repeat protein
MTAVAAAPGIDEEALGVLERVVAADPSDDEARRRYIEGATFLGAELRAAEALKAAIRREKSGEVRERVGLDVATLYLKEGELALARQAFLDVVVIGAGGAASLAAARKALELEGDPGEPYVLAASLEVVARMSPEAAERRDAAERMVTLHATAPMKDARLAVAYAALVDSPRADEALAWLRVFLEKKGDPAGLSSVLRAIAERSADPAAARAHALESMRLAAEAGEPIDGERWMWLVDRFGPDREAHRHLVPYLQAAERWTDLARVFAADAELAAATEQAPILAALADVLLTRTGDAVGALAALRRSLALDPAQPEALAAVERMLSGNEHALEAADILEPIYARERSIQGQLAVLETRARLLPEEGQRLASLTAAIDLALLAGLADRAVVLCRHAINADPSSPELHERYDALVTSESPSERIARYEAAFARTEDSARRRRLRDTIAQLRANEGDLRGAMAVWREIAVEEPANEAVRGLLVDAAIRLDDPAVVSLLDAAREGLSGSARDAMTLRKAVWLAGHGAGEAALELCRELAMQPLEPRDLDTIAEIASDHDDPLLRQRVLDRLATDGEPATRSRALEQLGDLQFEQLGNRRAAVSSWKAAAAACGDDRAHALALYERALDAVPEDGEAAERLVELYAAAEGWGRLPDVLWPMARSGDPEKTASYLLRFHEEALEARAIDVFVALSDEVLPRLDATAPSRLALQRARAAALAADPSRAALASEALRALVEASGDADALRAFEAFVESRPNAEERHEERRWLYSWRADHAENPARALLEWAKAEEEFGEPDEALVAYERLLEVDPFQRDALEASCRAHLRRGDLAGGLSALGRLRELTAPAERSALNVRVAEWLATEFGRTAEAAAVLAPVLTEDPPVAAARELGRRLLADPATAREVLDRFEASAASVSPGSAGSLWEFLLSAKEETGPLPEERVRWYLRILETSPEPTETALAYAVDGAAESPESVALWDAAERLGRALGRPKVVADAYHRVFASSVVSGGAADALGRRMAAFEDDCAIASDATMEALLSVLDLAPGARWALDRVKLALGAQARWDELFALYDKAILAAARDDERADLLHEAASAAKDLAGEPRRATSYFEFLRALRPDDTAVDAALERLYEKQGQRAELIGLLERRSEVTTGFKLRELRRRIAVLWLELGETEYASTVLDRMLAEDTRVGDVSDLLERVARPSPSDSAGAVASATRAVDLLIGHYSELDQPGDLVRIAELAIDLGDAAGQLSDRVRAWVGFVLLASRTGDRGPFACALERTAEHLARDSRLAATAYRSLLVRGARAWRRATTDAARADAERGAYGAVEALATLLVQTGRAAAAFRLLHRASRLPFERERRRDLLCTAALVCADVVGAAQRATRVFDELFDDDPADDIAASAMGRFAELLDALGEHEKLAARWEEQARIRAREGVTEAARASWERAGRLWEGLKRWEKAVTAYREGASLESQVSFDALARIHRARGQWQDAAQALEWLYSHADGAERARRALELTDAYVELGDRDRARSRLEDAFPGAVDTERADEVRERLLDLYRRDGVWRPLARLLSAEAVRVSDLDRKLTLVREACEILQRELKEPAAAAALLHQAVDWAPRDEGLRRWLVDVLESLARWDDAARVLEGQVALLAGQRSKDLAFVHHRLSRMLVQGGRPKEALAELRTAAEMAPAEVAILRDLGRVALDVGDLDLSESTYRALLLAIRRPGTDGSVDRAEVFLDLGEIALRRGDAERGDDLTDSAFDEAIAGPGEGLAVLERHLLARGRHELLAREEERCADRASTLAQRARSLGQWVGVWAHLGRPADVAARIRGHVDRTARDVEQERLTDPGAWSALAAVQAAVGHEAIRDRLAASLESAVAAVDDAAARSQLRVSLARLLLEAPARSAAATAALQAALADDPASREAAEQLSQALEREGRYEELVEALERSMRALSPERDAHKFASAMWRLGRALEQSSRTEAALELYESVLEQPAVDPDLLGELSVRLSELGSRRLGDCLERRLSLDPRAAAEIAPRLVALRDAEGDRAGAARALEAAFDVDPTSASIRDRLVDHYEQEQRWDRAADVLRRGIAATPDDRALLRRWLEVLGRAGAHDDVRRAVDAALLRHPNDAELLAARASARERVGDVDGAVVDLEAASAGDSRLLHPLLDLLLRVVAGGTTAGDGAHVLRLADLLIRFGRPKEARVHLERLHARSPGRRDVLRKIAFAASAERDWDAAGGAYVELLRLAERDDARDEVARVAIALVGAYEKAGRIEHARAVLRPTLEAWMARGDGSAELERLSEAVGDFEGLAHALVRRAEANPNPAEKQALLLRAARLELDHGGDPAHALSVLEQARAAGSDHLDVTILWARAQVTLGQVDVALAALSEAAERSRNSRQELAIIQLEMGRAYLAVDDLAEAHEALKAAFASDWRAGDLAMLLGLVSLDLGDDKTAERALIAVTTMPPRRDVADGPVKALAFYHLASMAYGRGEVAKAKLLATKAAGGDPSAQAAARVLLDKLRAV